MSFISYLKKNLLLSEIYSAAYQNKLSSGFTLIYGSVAAVKIALIIQIRPVRFLPKKTGETIHTGLNLCFSSDDHLITERKRRNLRRQLR